MTTIQQHHPIATMKPGAAPAVEFVDLGPDAAMSCEAIETVADGRPARFTSAAAEAMARSRRVLEMAHTRGDSIYGLTTGFGPHVRFDADADAHRQGAGLIAHLAAGWGPLASERVVRATIAARCQAIAQGCSGIEPDAADALLALLNRGVVPAIPEIGSVGASGDLIPLSHVARVLTGVGRVRDRHGQAVPARAALRDAGLEPIELSGRDALAIVNGTSFMTAYAALALARAERLISVAERLTGWCYAALGARREALDHRIHSARGHAGQARSAAAILRSIPAGVQEDASRPLQEVYSVRCAPQFLGACRDQIDHARTQIERELAGVNDNPVVWGDEHHGCVLHGGNFQGQQIAFAADAINAALTQTATLIERQLDVVLNPELNGGAPLLLAWRPGATSGMAGAQITATAIVADLRRSATPSAIASLPTNGRNQDVVSMGTMAARVAYEQTDRLAAVLAIHAVGLEQLAFLRSHGRAEGVAVHCPAWCPPIEGFREDRALHEDIQRLSAAFVAPGA